MFLRPLLARNRALLEAAVTLHQAGAIPANACVLDLDAIETNARTMAAEAGRLGLSLFAMTKQIGRNPPAMDAIRRGGIDRFVAVDMVCARAITRAGHRLAHLGHLSQVPRHEAAEGAAMRPDFWTVFNEEKAGEAAAAAHAAGREQPLLARLWDGGDRFYDGHEGGFPAAGVTELADRIDALAGARFAGITTFPAMLFDAAAGAVRPTPNLTTLRRAAEALAAAGRRDIAINAPGTTSAAVMADLAAAGTTQIEPGHGLTGTTPLHAVRDDLPETPAVLYLSEVSHIHQGTAFAFGGGLYVDPVFADYPVSALVGPDPETALSQRVRATIPAPSAIDYYGKLHPEPDQRVRPGDTVIYGFRQQAFFRRPFIVPVAGIASGRPEVRGIWSVEGREAHFG